jgi:hypothetical protein
LIIPHDIPPLVPSLLNQPGKEGDGSGVVITSQSDKDDYQGVEELESDVVQLNCPELQGDVVEISGHGENE